jgi:rRNA maturation endonuclease Nob1
MLVYGINVKGYIDDSIVQYNVHIGAGARRCPNCGREVNANETFCMDCGAKL